MRKTGYRKVKDLDGNPLYAVTGRFFFLDFNVAPTFSEIGLKKNVRLKKIDIPTTHEILEYFQGQENIYIDLVSEIIRIDRFPFRTCNIFGLLGKKFPAILIILDFFQILLFFKKIRALFILLFGR